MTSPNWPNDDSLSESVRASASEAPNHSLAPDLVFTLLANERNRDLLYALRDHDGPLPIEAAVERLADRETESAGGVPSPAVKRRVRICLHHALVPRVIDYGVVDYDPDADALRFTDAGERLEPYLEFVRERDRTAGRPVLEGVTKSDR